MIFATRRVLADAPYFSASGKKRIFEKFQKVKGWGGKESFCQIQPKFELVSPKIKFLFPYLPSRRAQKNLKKIPKDGKFQDEEKSQTNFFV